MRDKNVVDFAAAVKKQSEEPSLIYIPKDDDEPISVFKPVEKEVLKSKSDKKDKYLFIMSKADFWAYIKKELSNDENDIEKARKDLPKLIKKFNDGGRTIDGFVKLVEDTKWYIQHRWTLLF